MKTKLTLVTWLLALGSLAIAQTTTLTENNSTGKINTAAGVTPNIPALAIAGVTQFHTPQDYGAIGDGNSHPLSGVYSTLSAAQADYSFTLTGCGYSSASTTVTCADATFLDVGYPISGSGIPSGATVASVTDSTHFVLSASPTNGTPVSGGTLTSSYITSLTQESDYVGLQKCVWINGNMLLSGTYLTGSSTLKIKTPNVSNGYLITGLGGSVSQIKVDAGTDGIRVMQGYALLQNFAVIYTGGNGSTANGIILDTRASEMNPPNYTWNWHLDHLYLRGFARGVYNPYKWDEGSITRCECVWCGTAIKTVGNLDTLKISASDTTALAGTLSTSVTITSISSTSPIVHCTSTANLLPGMQINGTGFATDDVSIVSVDSGTQITLSQNASTTATSGTLTAQSVALWVDSDGRACWSGGVVSGGYALYGSSNVGALLIAEDMHYEGTGGTYIYVPVNGCAHVLRCFFADSTATYLAFVDSGARMHFDGVEGPAPNAVFENGRGDIQSANSRSPIDVNWNNAFHYNAVPWHTAAYDETPGAASYWDAPSASTEGRLVSQCGFQSGTYRNKLWQCIKTGASTWAWQVINGAVTSDDVATVAHGGTGTASPGLVAGTNVTITGSWPNQTVNASGGATLLYSVYNNVPGSQSFGSTTFADLTETTGTLASVPTGTYRADLFFSIFSQDAGFKWQLGGTATLEANHRAQGVHDSGSIVQLSDFKSGEGATWSGSTQTWHYTAIITVTGSGSIKIQGAENASSANATFMNEAALTLTKIQ